MIDLGKVSEETLSIKERRVENEAGEPLDQGSVS